MTRWAQWRQDERPGSPWDNMAADVALLSAISGGQQDVPIVRLYQWDRPSVSIGRLQREEPVRRLYPDLPCVRRPTGGRAVVHGQDLTVSVAARTDWLPGDAGRTVLTSYHLLMAGLIEALAGAGHETSFGAEACGVGGNINCFDSIAGCDLVDVRTGRKIVGSAQRRVGETLLQQMSLPLSLVPDLAAFAASLRRGIGDALHVEEWQFIDTNCAV